MVILIGLTGGIACGKSTVSEYLVQHGLVSDLIDADGIVRSLQEPGTFCTRRIRRAWPEVVDEATGEIRRTLLSEMVFSDPACRRKLHRIMMPAIICHILLAMVRSWWSSFLRDVWGSLSGSGQVKPSIILVDAPTLYETRVLLPFLSGVLVVACDPSTQVQRLQQRNGMTEASAEKRLASQMPLEKKRQLAGYVIENRAACSKEDLYAEVEKCVASWMQKQAGSSWSLWVLCVGLPGIMTAAVVCGGALLMKAFQR